MVPQDGFEPPTLGASILRSKPAELPGHINGEIGARLSPGPSIGLYHGGTGDATGIRTPVTGETVRHNNLYMMAPYISLFDPSRQTLSTHLLPRRSRE